MLTKIFNAIKDYGPGLALAVGGGMVAGDYLATGRYDLLSGGLSLLALGLMIADANGPNIISRYILRNREDIGDLMGMTGLFSVAALGGGEVLHLADKYGLTFDRIGDMAAYSPILKDPGIYKVAANFSVYTLVSLMDFKGIASAFQKSVSERNYRLIQTGLSVAGAYMIGQFGAEGRIFSARMFGNINAAANIYSFAAKKHAEASP